MVDSGDLDRLDEARTELLRVVNDREMTNVVVLVFANKQDLPGALRPAELQEKLSLNRLGPNRVWSIQPTCATSGDGIYEGLSWLAASCKGVGGHGPEGRK